MSTPDYCTLDGDPGTSVQPYVPTVDDMGGAAFVDDDVYPPEPEENVMSRDINQMQELLVRACSMVSKASFEVRYSTSTGLITLLGFKSSNALFLASQVTLTSAAQGFSIRWPLGSLPVAVVGPTLSASHISALDGTASEQAVTITVSQQVGAPWAYAVVSMDGFAGALTAAELTCRIDVDGEGVFGI